MAHEFIARKGLISSGSINVSGSVTASYFKGDGSQLTNLPSLNTALNVDTYKFIGNGITNTYVLSQSYNINSLEVSVGGLRLTSIVDYTLSDTSCIFLDTPPSESNILIRAYVNASTGVTGSFSGSFFGSIASASYAVTASYAANGGTSIPAGTVSASSQIDVRNTTGIATIATTGSNTFNGTQTVTGSLYTSGSNNLIGSTTLTGSLNVTGSTTQIGNNNLFGNTTLSGSLIVSGAVGTATPYVQIYGDTSVHGYMQFEPVTTNIDTSISASYIYVSGSTKDLYFSQNGSGYNNVTRLRWLESNLYTGILHGGVLSSTPGSTTFNITSGSGIIVTLNASTGSAPYPTVQYVEWGTKTNIPITYSGSGKITYVGLDNSGNVVQQLASWGSTDINQWDTQIALGVVLHLTGSVSTGVFNSQQISYGGPQKNDDFLRAFGPLKISGHTLQASGSSPTLSIKKTGGTAYREGANYAINPNHPSTVIENDTTVSKIYRYYISGSTPVIDTGVAAAGYTTIDNTKYVDTTTGALTSVGNSNWSIQRVFWIPNSPTNAFIVYYGNASYGTLLNAVNAKDSEPFTEAPNTALNAIFLGYIIVEGGSGRDLLNAAEATIIPGGLFRNVGGIASSGTSPVATALASLSDVSISGQSTGDILVYNGATWNNTKTLNGAYSLTGSLTTNAGITAGTVTATSVSASFSGSGANIYGVQYTTLTSIPSGIVSSSAQVTTLLPSGTVSSSAQTITYISNQLISPAGVSSSNHITPTTDNSYNLGAADKRWANIYTGDLNLSNEGSSGNIIDGTTGNWTIQEGMNSLYILNNKNGKKFKIMLEEIE